MPKRSRKDAKDKKARAVAASLARLDKILQHSEFDKTNKRDIALLEHGWAPQETKFGEEFKGKNKIIIA